MKKGMIKGSRKLLEKIQHAGNRYATFLMIKISRIGFNAVVIGKLKDPIACSRHHYPGGTVLQVRNPFGLAMVKASR